MRSICIASGKGGVGKTTSAINIAHLLSRHKKVLLMDANLTTPNVHLHLGWPILKKTLLDVLNGKASLNEATYMHASGLRILPSITTLNDLKSIKHDSLKEIVTDLYDAADIILMDCAAGLGDEAVGAMDAADEILIITSPDLPSVIDAQKAVEVAHELGKVVLGAVINKARGDRQELRTEEVERLLDIPVIGVIPFDESVRKALMRKKPVTEAHPHSKASRSYEQVAGMLLGQRYLREGRRSTGLFSYVLGRFGF